MSRCRVDLPMVIAIVVLTTGLTLAIPSASAEGIGGEASPSPVPSASPGQSPVAEPTAHGWQSLWHPAFRPRVGHTSLGGVDRLDDGFVISGSDGAGAIAWWSQDGIEWTRSKTTDPREGGTGVAVAGAPGSWVMVGYRVVPDWRPLIWHSVDGIHWMVAETRLPKGSRARWVVRRVDGSFVAGGASPWGPGCWTVRSEDGGASWERTSSRTCLGSVTPDGDDYLGVGQAGLKISSSPDAITWTVEGTSKAAVSARREAWGDAWPDDYIPAGVTPAGEGRFLLGGRGTQTLAWSREDGFVIEDGPIDWSSLSALESNRLAVGTDRSVLVQEVGEAPLVVPPPGRYESRAPDRDDACPLVPTVYMSPEARISCFANRTLTFEAWSQAWVENEGVCPVPSSSSWLICFDAPVALGLGGGADWLEVAVRPSDKDTLGRLLTLSGAHLRIRGHVDDPAARRCPREKPDGWPWTYRIGCRAAFVVDGVKLLDSR